MMDSRLFIAFASAMLIAGGCAGLNENEKRYGELGAQVSELRASVDDLGSRVEELNNKFTLLHEKVSPVAPAEAEGPALNLNEDSAPRTQGTQAPSMPPEGLKVVSLDEEGRVKAGESPLGKGASETAMDPAIKEAAGPQKLYGAGQDHFLSGRYADARSAFSELARLYPKDALADNALYWIGESHYSEKDFDAALKRFREVLERYPSENKAPDALFKIALTYAEMMDMARARESLDAVIKRYPSTEAAANARKAVKRLFPTGRK